MVRNVLISIYFKGNIFISELLSIQQVVTHWTGVLTCSSTMENFVLSDARACIFVLRISGFKPEIFCLFTKKNLHIAALTLLLP